MEINNGEFTHFCRVYNLQFKPHTPNAPWSNGLAEFSNRQLNTFLRIVLESQHDTWSQIFETFPFAFNSQNRTNLNLSAYELVFAIKPKEPKMFNLCSNRDSFGNFQPSKNSPCHFFQNSQILTILITTHKFKNCRKDPLHTGL